MTMTQQQYNLDDLAKSALLEKGFLPDFSPAIQQEIGTLSEPSFPLPNLEAKDMRKNLWFSLDNDDSRDLDQLTYAEKLADGRNKIYVAIACVDLLVKKESAIDV